MKQPNQNSEKTILKAIKMYQEGKGSIFISNALNVGQGTILKWLDKAGVKKRNPKRSYGVDWDKIRRKVSPLPEKEEE